MREEGRKEEAVSLEGPVASLALASFAPADTAADFSLACLRLRAWTGSGVAGGPAAGFQARPGDAFADASDLGCEASVGVRARPTEQGDGGVGPLLAAGHEPSGSVKADLANRPERGAGWRQARARCMPLSH